MSSAAAPLPRQPLIFALLCYVSWGVFPLYWRLLSHLSAVETLSHRFIWSFVFYLLVLALAHRRVTLIRPNVRDWAMAGLAGLLLAVNWGVFIYAINTHRVLEGSLAYFINPLLSVAVGVACFREPFPRLLKLAFVMALAGVLVRAAFSHAFPWIALTLAVSFCLYGVVKKTVRIEPAQFSLMESAAGLLPALMLAWWARGQAGAELTPHDWALLMGAGVVTGLPLFLFAVAARHLPYSLLGMLQFIGPTLQFIVGILVFHESIGWAEGAAFGLIWAGVGFYLADKAVNARRNRQRPVTSGPRGSLVE